MTIDHDIPYGRQTITDADVAAVNEALRTAESEMAAAMQKITGGLSLPF